MDTVKIGKFLSELRREQELTQEQLAEKLGTSNKTISRWENGNYMPPVEMLMELSKFYGVSINEMLSGKRLSPPPRKILRACWGTARFRSKTENNILPKSGKESIGSPLWSRPFLPWQ